MFRVSKLLRPLARLYPIEIGKGWIAAMLKDENVPEGELVRTSEGVMVRTHADYSFKHPYLFGEYEPVVTAAFKKVIRSGDVCFDVGANFGFFTCLFALWGADVYAFEPLPSTFALNEETVRLNHCESKVKAFNCGLGEKAGTIRIHTFKSLSHGRASSSNLGRADAVPHECKISTLDDVCAEQNIKKISFVKIDVEGFEYEVLKGGQKTLSKPDAPIVHFEVNAECVRSRNLSPDEIVSLLKSYGYIEFIQISRYKGILKAPEKLPVSDLDYLAFKDTSRLANLIG